MSVFAMEKKMFKDKKWSLDVVIVGVSWYFKDGRRGRYTVQQISDQIGYSVELCNEVIQKYIENKQMNLFEEYRSK